MTIYLPDDLAEQVKAESDLNTSAVCQKALRSELGHRSELAKLDVNMERVEHYIGETGLTVAFYGVLLAADQYLTVYLTKRHRIAVYDESDHTLVDFDTFDDFDIEMYHRDPQLQMFIAEVGQALGHDSVVELDL